ncbi:serpin B7-like [Cynocephalus volans]|uniref:serpin B7-like n=1 Tax=Cynocephalus volans TaxID=110931 RepID=UPI002FC956F6
MGSLSAANAQFCFDVFKEMSYDHTIENLFFSPVALLSALAVVLFGARGDSASQMEKCAQDTHSHIQAFLSEINKSSNSHVHMASGIFAEEAYPFLPSQSKTVQMMWLQGHFRLGTIKEPPIQVLEMPDSEDHLSMVIVLPSKDFSLGQIIKEITYEELKNWIDPAIMKDTAVDLYLPQLRLDECHEDLTSILSALGMADVFDHSRADLSGVTTGGRLVVSKIIQKAMVEVTEDGSESAPTNHTSEVENPEIFKVDHPFLFFILHQKTKMILFYGRVSTP